jgi:hypothetical protein
VLIRLHFGTRTCLTSAKRDGIRPAFQGEFDWNGENYVAASGVWLVNKDVRSSIYADSRVSPGAM